MWRRAPSHQTSPLLGISLRLLMNVEYVSLNASAVLLLACCSYISVAHSLPVALCMRSELLTMSSASAK